MNGRETNDDSLEVGDPDDAKPISMSSTMAAVSAEGVLDGALIAVDPHLGIENVLLVSG